MIFALFIYALILLQIKNLVLLKLMLSEFKSELVLLSIATKSIIAVISSIFVISCVLAIKVVICSEAPVLIVITVAEVAQRQI